MATEHLLLDLAVDANVVAVQRICEQARAAAQCGNETSIRCDDETCFDLGALQLLRSLLDEVQVTHLHFTSPQRARAFSGWLALVAR